MARIVALVLVVTLILLGVWFKFVSGGGLGEHAAPGVVTAEVRPSQVVNQRAQTLATAADEMLVSKANVSGKDDCLADHEPRAWSSPIFVDWKAEG